MELRYVLHFLLKLSTFCCISINVRVFLMYFKKYVVTVENAIHFLLTIGLPRKQCLASFPFINIYYILLIMYNIGLYLKLRS